MKGFCALAAVGALGVGVAASSSASSLALHDGVLVDEQVVYTMKPGGGIDALAVADGRVLWSSAAADRPISVDSGKLLAQRASRRPGELMLNFLDAGTGASIAERAVALPGDVLASVDERLDSRFHFEPQNMSATNNVGADLVWRYEYKAAQGIVPAAGAAPVNRRAGVLRAATDTLSVQTTSRAAPAGVVYNRVARVDFVRKGERGFYSEDRRHVLVSRRVEGSSGYEWRVHEATGAVVGQWPSSVSFAPFVVRAGHALFLTAPGVRRDGDVVTQRPRALTAVNLKSGERAWSHAVRDTRYTGPVAP